MEVRRRIHKETSARVSREEMLETTRAECRAEKITLAQSHRRVEGKVLHILYLKTFVGQLRYHTRALTRACRCICVRARCVND